MNEHYHQLITQYFDKSISDEGLTQLRDWLDQNPENQRQFRDSLKILEESRAWFKEPGAKDLAWSKIESRIAESESVITTASGYSRFYYYAAASLVFFLSVLGFWFNPFKPDPAGGEYVYFHNSRGKRSKIVLSDSSIVYLNAESSIRFLKHFKENVREIELSGEAFFDVQHDEERPFVVSSGAVKTTVLGTSFNIRAFGQDRRVAVTVQTGKVGVSMASAGGQKFLQYLLPGQQLNINTATGDYTFNSLDPSNASAWKDKKLVFDNDSFDEIAQSLRRWYNVNVVLTHPENTQSRYTANFDNMHLNEVMDIMHQLSGCTYKLEKDKLIINNGNCK